MFPLGVFFLVFSTAATSLGTSRSMTAAWPSDFYYFGVSGSPSFGLNIGALRNLTEDIRPASVGRSHKTFHFCFWLKTKKSGGLGHKYFRQLTMTARGWLCLFSTPGHQKLGRWAKKEETVRPRRRNWPPQVMAWESARFQATELQNSSILTKSQPPQRKRGDWRHREI